MLLAVHGFATAAGCGQGAVGDDDDDDDARRDSGDWAGAGGDAGSGSGSGGGTGTGTGSGDPGDDESSPTGSPSVSVSWDSYSLTVSVSGRAGPWRLGIAETYNCSLCWTGEDCLYGFTYNGTTRSYCHELEASSTSLAYGGVWTALEPGQTVFDASYENRVGFYLESVAEGDCFIWGRELAHFEGLGCTEL